MMTKKRLIISFLSLVLSLFAFTAATYAWFAISNQTEASPFNLGVDPGIIKDYEIRYYNANKVYKYDKDAHDIYVWNGSTYVEPVYTNLDDLGYDYSGLFMEFYWK